MARLLKHEVATVQSERQRLYLPKGTAGSTLESCTPKPFVLGEQCPSCRQAKLLEAVTPMRVRITDSNVDTSLPLFKAIFGGYYIRDDYVEAYLSVKPGAQLIVPSVDHRSLRPMLRYRRVVEGSKLVLDRDSSHFAFSATCRTCNHVLDYDDKIFTDETRKAYERLKGDPRYVVTEYETTQLKFEAQQKSVSGVYRWMTRYFLDEDMAVFARSLVDCDLREDTVQVEVVVV